ncbi:terminase large subunit domain-containing protein [Xenorhabdus sp. PB30.3]|uniref:terminase large subunit domain-containing protein n=1 Tax=Xenorhabdus sp. PB30.3 TaxID=2788941 RepID=UPI001E505B04|nr:terminase family protein [Xenorhabdus sp. PB30.3]MCC8379555.1 terminase family protein [Xenorhabdus sp. PB30.3]
MKTTAHDPRQEAKNLYWQAYSVAQIAKRLGVSVNTLYSWRRRDKWDDAHPIERVSDDLHVKILRMQAKDALTPHDFKTLDFFYRQLQRFDRHEEKKESTKKAKTPKNHFTEEQITELRAMVYESLFEYQKRWYKQKERRNRMILKSRQIGATWYFAREALITALETGNNQIFLSASRAQAFQFKKFIQIVARQVGVELKGGDEIILSNGATLYFLGTSAASAQSYTGDLYFDEFFWVSNFLNLRKVAAGMATHIGLRRTYFSTPSSEEHKAYPFWTGDFFNQSRPNKKQISIDTRHATLQPGVLCGDNIWRQIVTIHDAIALGLDRVDLDEIESENSPADFDNLYRCIFVRAGERAFDYNEVIKCGVDGYSKEVWPDWQPYAPRPLGHKGIYIGADPTGTGGNGDGLGLVVMSPPAVSGGKWRVIEALQFRGMAFEKQADEIRRLTARYHVLGIVIDGTGGTGEAVHELVCKFFPAATLLKYSAPLKRMLVMKAQMLIRSGRFEYDAGMKQVATSFMSIKKIITQGGVVTYDADRTRGIDHGDIAWAVMNVLHGEPISSDSGGYTSFVTEF